MFYKQNKRILLVSNTNLAVDLLLKSLCKHLKNIQDKNFLNSSVLRFGKIQDTELENSYGVIRGEYQLREKGQHCFGPKGIIEGSLDTSNRYIKMTTYWKGTQMSNLSGTIGSQSSFKLNGTNSNGVNELWVLKIKR